MDLSVAVPMEVWGLVHAFVALDPAGVSPSVSGAVWPVWPKLGDWLSQSDGRALASTCRAFRAQGWHSRALCVRTTCELLWTWTSCRLDMDHLSWAKITLVDSPEDSPDHEWWFSHAFELLSKAPNLSRLELVTEPDIILGPIGVYKGLMMLGSCCPALQHFRLQSSEEIGMDEATLMCALGRAKSIRTLHLGLEGSSFAAGAMAQLALLTLDSPLVGLSFNLNYTWIEDGGAQELAQLCRGAHLRDLRLSLVGNGLSDSSGAALGTLLRWPSLRSLWIDLSDNEFTDASAAEFASLGTDTSLEDLNVNLSYNMAGDEIAQSFTAAVSAARSVRSVRLGLKGEYHTSRGSIGDVGALALSSLMYLPWLKSLTLDLRDNPINQAGYQELRNGEEWPNKVHGWLSMESMAREVLLSPLQSWS